MQLSSAQLASHHRRSWPGLESFRGRVVHAKDFGHAGDLRDERVLVIGTSSSAEDIAAQCVKFGCQSLTLSWRSAPMEFACPTPATH